jgi:hypothetical protein
MFEFLKPKKDPVDELLKLIAQRINRIDELCRRVEQLDKKIDKLLTQGTKSMTLQQEIIDAVDACTTGVDAFIAFAQGRVANNTITREAGNARSQPTRRDEAAIQNGLQPPPPPANP